MGPRPDLLNQSLREERLGNFHFESTPLVTFIGSVSLILFFRGWVLYDGCCCSCFRIPFWESSFGKSIPIPLSPEVTSSVEHSALSFASVLLIPSATSLLNLVSQSITFLFRQGFVLLEGCICWIFLKSSGFRRPHYSICRCFCYKFCTHQLRACDDSFQFCGSQTYLSCSVQE